MAVYRGLGANPDAPGFRDATGRQRSQPRSTSTKGAQYFGSRLRASLSPIQSSWVLRSACAGERWPCGSSQFLCIPSGRVMIVVDLAQGQHSGSGAIGSDGQQVAPGAQLPQRLALHPVAAL